MQACCLQCSSDMKKDMYETNAVPTLADDLAVALEQECEIWDWVRAAGVSAQDLRSTLLETLGLRKAA